MCTGKMLGVCTGKKGCGQINMFHVHLNRSMYSKMLGVSTSEMIYVQVNRSISLYR